MALRIVDPAPSPKPPPDSRKRPAPTSSTDEGDAPAREEEHKPTAPGNAGIVAGVLEEETT